MSAALQSKRLSASKRERLRVALAAAVEAGRLSQDEADDLLVALDSGTATLDDLPADARASLDGDSSDGAVAALALGALAVIAWAKPTRSGPAIQWGWDAERAAYVTSQSVALHPLWVRREFDRMLERSSAEFVETASAPARGAVIRTEWLRDMEERILARHAAAAALARGGLAQMTDDDRQWLRGEVLGQYGYLDGFEADQRRADAAGKPMSDAAIRARAEMYNQAARGTYEEMRRRSEAARGMRFEQRFLTVGENCDDCEAEAGKGKQPVGTLRRISDSVCLTRCHCWFQFYEN